MGAGFYNPGQVVLRLSDLCLSVASIFNGIDDYITCAAAIVAEMRQDLND